MGLTNDVEQTTVKGESEIGKGLGVIHHLYYCGCQGYSEYEVVVKLTVRKEGGKIISI